MGKGNHGAYPPTNNLPPEVKMTMLEPAGLHMHCNPPREYLFLPCSSEDLNIYFWPVGGETNQLTTCVFKIPWVALVVCDSTQVTVDCEFWRGCSFHGYCCALMCFIP